jgi:hypothetical protein
MIHKEKESTVKTPADNERFTASVGVCSLDNKCVTSPLVRRGKFSEPHACGKPPSRYRQAGRQCVRTADSDRK